MATLGKLGSAVMISLSGKDSRHWGWNVKMLKRAVENYVPDAQEQRLIADSKAPSKSAAASSQVNRWAV